MVQGTAGGPSSHGKMPRPIRDSTEVNRFPRLMLPAQVDTI